MPPKKEEKKEIVRAFEAGKFWKYLDPPHDVIQKASAFLTTFDKQLGELISQQKTLEQNFELLCQKMGLTIHPCLQNRAKQESKFPELKNKQYGARLFQIANFRIDPLTIKLVSFLINIYKVNSIKLCRNELTHESAELIKKMLEKENSASTIFFQWNPLQQFPNRRDVFLSTVRPTIQHLILRENNISNQICIDILNKIKETPEIRIKSLDFAGNQIGPEVSPVLSKFIEEDKHIEFLGLSKNRLGNAQFLGKMFGSIGQVPLSEQDYAKHLESVKARDEVVERNKKKKKGAPDEPLPFVFELKQNEKGRFFVKNVSLVNLNLAKNGINDSCLSLIKGFSQNQGSKVQVFLDSNKFSKKSKDILQIYKNLLL